MKVTSKHVGKIAAILFFVMLVFFTIYSRSYAERQKPFVHIAFSESGSLLWQYEARIVVEPANEDAASQGFEWMIVSPIPLEAFEKYMSTLGAVSAQVILDSVVFPITLNYLNRRELENGDVVYYWGLVLHRDLWQNEEGLIRYTMPEGLFFQNLIPISAVHFDNTIGRHFIFVVEEVNRAWGREFMAVRRNVEMGIPQRVNNTYNVLTALDGVPIVAFSEVFLFDRQTVRIFD